MRRIFKEVKAIKNFRSQKCDLLKRLFISMFISLFINCYESKCQIITEVENWIDLIDENEDDTISESFMESLIEEFTDLLSNPININKANHKEWQKLTFLSDTQIQSLIDYREKYGEMVSIYELKNIETLDFHTIQLMIPFVYISDDFVNKRSITVHNLLNYGNNELIFRYDHCFQQKEGYSLKPDSILADYPNRMYLGESFYHTFRYSFNYDNRLLVGMVAEKDAGEPFMKQNHKGYDYYSFHILLKDINRLKNLIIGDYKVSFGQGLLINQGYSPGKSTLITQGGLRNYGFRRHYSTNEFDYLRGVATTFSFDKVDVSVFYSLRKLDGNVSDTVIYSIKKDGLHQIEREMNKKHTIQMRTYGMSFRYLTADFIIGINGLMYDFTDKELQPDLKPYNLYYFRGNKNKNLSVDYLWKRNKVCVYGETGMSANQSFSTINGIQFSPAAYVHMLALYRYYDKKYHAFFGRSISQSSGVQNEEGFYLGMLITPYPYIKLTGYMDIFRHPWLRYQVDAPSKGQEYMCRIDYTPYDFFSINIRHRYRKKEKNYKTGIQSHYIFPDAQHRSKLQASYQFKDIHARTIIEHTIYSFVEKKSKGYMISQSVGWKPVNIPVQADLFGGYFHTDDYSSRINAYEKNILYAYYLPSFYGEGLRLSSVIRFYIMKKLSLSCKISYSHYFDRDKIGSGLEEIDGNQKLDMQLQLQWKF